jgi:hypothetical protein
MFNVTLPTAPACLYEWFGTTPRWTKPNWRIRRRALDLRLDPVRSVADLRQGLQRIAVCAYLADVPVLHREVLPYGHFSIGGDHKRVVILSLLTPGAGCELRGDLRACLLSLVTRETAEYARLVGMLREAS